MKPVEIFEYFNKRRRWWNLSRYRGRKSTFNWGPGKQGWRCLKLFNQEAYYYFLLFCWCLWIHKSSSKVVLFLNVFLDLVAFFSCNSSAVMFELLKNICGMLFFFSFLLCMWISWIVTLWLASVLLICGITYLKRTKELPCTESVLVTQSCCAVDCFSLNTSVGSFRAWKSRRSIPVSMILGFCDLCRMFKFCVLFQLEDF